MNPFPTVNYIGPAYFCDRQAETKELLSNIKNGRNSLLISPRRLGKTSLIRHVFNQLPKKWDCIYIDLNNTSSIKDLLSVLTSEIANLAISKTSWKQVLKSWKVAVEVDPFTGAIMGSMAWVKPNMEKKTVEELFNILGKEAEEVVIAMDEFQRITEYKDENTEGWLRSLAQQYPSIRFIYSGSHQRVLNEIFNSHKRPFYRSTSMLRLTVIERSTYVDFIHAHFSKARKKVSIETVELIYDQMEGKTAYIQEICNRLFERSNKVISSQEVMHTIGFLMDKNEQYYSVILRGLTKIQADVLNGIAKLNKVYAVTGTEMVKISGVANAKSIALSVEKLLDLELVYQDEDTDQDKKGSYVTIDDVFLRLWLLRTFRA